MVIKRAGDPVCDDCLLLRGKTAWGEAVGRETSQLQAHMIQDYDSSRNPAFATVTLFSLDFLRELLVELYMPF